MSSVGGHDSGFTYHRSTVTGTGTFNIQTLALSGFSSVCGLPGPLSTPGFPSHDPPKSYNAPLVRACKSISSLDLAGSLCKSRQCFYTSRNSTFPPPSVSVLVRHVDQVYRRVSYLFEHDPHFFWRAPHLIPTRDSPTQYLYL